MAQQIQIAARFRPIARRTEATWQLTELEGKRHRSIANRTLWWGCCLGSLLLGVVPSSLAGHPNPIVGLDHVPVAVRDMERASATYRDLGFAIKPGCYHTNGIRNAQVKLRDCSRIELLTARAAVDDLTARYLERFALHARDIGLLLAGLNLVGYAFSRNGDVIDLQRPALTYPFVVRDNRSPTDRTEQCSLLLIERPAQSTRAMQAAA